MHKNISNERLYSLYKEFPQTALITLNYENYII